MAAPRQDLRLSGLHLSWLRRAIMIVPALLLAAALFARLMTAPLRRDEQLFYSIPMLADAGDIYRDFGFNHLPNLALLMGPVLRMADMPFTAGRSLIFLAWLATAALLAAHTWRVTRSSAMVALAVLLLATSPLLINQTGMTISNNFLPIPFVLGGALAFFIALDRDPHSIWLIVLSGVLLAIAAGFKANYVFAIPPFAIATLMLPVALSLVERLLKVALPLLAGGLIGGIPTLHRLLTDPDGFLTHVLGYHQGPHAEFAALSTEPLIVSLGDRAMLAQGLWGSGGVLLIGFSIVTILLARVGSGWRPGWKLWIGGGLVFLAMAVSFVPTPAFPQYFSPPAVLLILFLVLLVGELPPPGRQTVRPLLLALGLLALLIDGPRLIRNLPALGQPAQWTGSEVHRISATVVAAAGTKPVATLSPIYALDAGGQIYPELAGGQFIYRVADLIPPEDRRHYRLVSAATLQALLDSNPPGAILVGTEGALDEAFRRYAKARGYVASPLPEADTRYGRLELFVQPAP